nr:ATP synthase CF0 B' subunit [Cavernulicola chilensis]
MIQQLFLISTQIVILDSESGGLFDFNATLPFMAIQFLLLTLLLNIVFYGPVTNVLDKRDDYIRTSLESASTLLKEAEQLSIQHEKELVQARKEAQSLIKSSQKEAQSIVAVEVSQAQEEADRMIEESTQQLNTQKEDTIKNLEKYVETLSKQIYNKLLSGQSVV